MYATQKHKFKGFMYGHVEKLGFLIIDHVEKQRYQVKKKDWQSMCYCSSPKQLYGLSKPENTRYINKFPMYTN